MGRRATGVDLQAEDRPVLEGRAQRLKTPHRLAMQAQTMLKGGAGWSATATALERKVCLQTVGKWRKRYAERSADGLLDELKAAINEFTQYQNLESKPFNWSKTEDQILDSVASFYK